MSAVDTIIIQLAEVLVVLLVFFYLVNAIPFKGEKTGKLMIVGYNTFPFGHTSLTFATNSPSYGVLTVEGKLVTTSDGKPLYTETFVHARYRHVPFHWYNTLVSITVVVKE